MQLGEVRGAALGQIAVRLGISVKTAESHRTRIMTKLDVHDLAWSPDSTKLAYDVLLWREFRRVKPPEETEKKVPGTIS